MITEIENVFTSPGLEPSTFRLLLIYVNSVRTSLETHYVSATETNRLMLIEETAGAYSENGVEHTNTLRVYMQGS
jgi:hypothetical protein